MTDFGIPAYQGRPVNVDPGSITVPPMPPMSITGAGQGRRRGAGKTLAGGLKLRNAFRCTIIRWIAAIPPVGSVNRRNRPSASTTALRRRDDGFFNQTELTQTLATSAIGHQLLYGIEVGRQYKDQVTYSAANVATVALFDRCCRSCSAYGHMTTDNLGVLTVSSAYVRDFADLNAQWKALVGVRYDVFEQETHERRAGQADLEARPTGMTRVPAWCSSRPGSSRITCRTASRSSHPASRFCADRRQRRSGTGTDRRAGSGRQVRSHSMAGCRPVPPCSA